MTLDGSGQRARYERTMAIGASEYADVIAALRARGLPTEFIQTGGMSAAIEVRLEAGFHLLLTDAEDSLSWNRADHVGWYVGLYEAEDSTNRRYDGPMRYAIEDDDGSLDRALALVDRVLANSDDCEQGLPA